MKFKSTNLKACAVILISLLLASCTCDVPAFTITTSGAQKVDSIITFSASVKTCGDVSGKKCPCKTYAWDFGDGGTSTEENPSHTYTKSGNYAVSLVVSNGSKSHTMTYALVITVTPKGPVASIIFWTSNSTLGNIDINMQLQGLGHRVITGTYSVTPSCSTTFINAALFENVPMGTYYYTAVSASGTFSGTVYAPYSQCYPVRIY